MRFLLDENQSPLLGRLMEQAGHDVVHVRDVGLQAQPDPAVLEHARVEQRVLISGDTDFGEILARTRATGPSVVMIRRQGGRRAAQLAELIDANLDAVAQALLVGAIVVLDADRIRVRLLPIS